MTQLAMETGESRKESQTLMRGLDLIEAVAHGTAGYIELAERVGLTRSTAYRLASGLAERGYLVAIPRLGYRLGPKLLELGAMAQSQTDLVLVARPHLEALGTVTGDAVRLSVLQDGRVLYVDVVPGQRRVTITCRPGESQHLTTTSAGKALLLDAGEAAWRARLAADLADGRPEVDTDAWCAAMRGYVLAGASFGLGENGDEVRGVAAPVRDSTGQIVAAVSVSAVAQYLGDARMAELVPVVLGVAKAIGYELGCPAGG